MTIKIAPATTRRLAARMPMRGKRPDVAWEFPADPKLELSTPLMYRVNGKRGQQLIDHPSL